MGPGTNTYFTTSVSNAKTLIEIMNKTTINMSIINGNFTTTINRDFTENRTPNPYIKSVVLCQLSYEIIKKLTGVSQQLLVMVSI